MKSELTKALEQETLRIREGDKDVKKEEEIMRQAAESLIHGDTPTTQFTIGIYGLQKEYKDKSIFKQRRKSIDAIGGLWLGLKQG